MCEAPVAHRVSGGPGNRYEMTRKRIPESACVPHSDAVAHSAKESHQGKTGGKKKLNPVEQGDPAHIRSSWLDLSNCAARVLMIMARPITGRIDRLSPAFHLYVIRARVGIVARS